MRIGIIAEGRGDLGVVEHIVKGITGLDTNNFIHLRPADQFDETDLNDPTKLRSTWSLVREECLNGAAINDFLDLDDNAQYVIIHIDTDKAQDYGVLVPKRDKDYCTVIRGRVVEKIKDWLGGRFENQIIFAVAVEEIEAWLLTIYAKPRRDTSTLPNPKRTLEWILSKNSLNTTSDYRNYKQLSKPFSKKKEVESGNFF